MRSLVQVEIRNNIMLYKINYYLPTVLNLSFNPFLVNLHKVFHFREEKKHLENLD